MSRLLTSSPATLTSHRRAARPFALFGHLRRLFALRAQRRALARLDDHLLADIGLTPDAARIESERALWDVPAHWRG